MRSLPLLQSKDDCIKVLETLKKDPLTKAWAKHKERAWILCGLNKYCSNMDQFIFESIPKQSNVVESMHRRANQNGIQQPLLSAILRYDID